LQPRDLLTLNKFLPKRILKIRGTVLYTSTFLLDLNGWNWNM
jgi:hypothetical protein